MRIIRFVRIVGVVRMIRFTGMIVGVAAVVRVEGLGPESENH